jgi:hypothetical protein
LAVTLDGCDSSEDTICECVIFLAGVCARYDTASRFIDDGDTMHAETVFATSQGHIAATQFFFLRRNDGYSIFIKNVGSHT